MYEQGLSLSEVARRLGTTVYVVRQAVLAQGGVIRPPGGRPGPVRPIDIERARAMYEAGMSIRRIAEELGASRCRVHTQLRAAGVRMRDVRSPRASRITEEKRAAILQACRERVPLAEICARLRTSRRTIMRVLGEAGVERVPLRRRLDHERMAALYAQGWKLAAIAADQGTTRQYVWHVLRRRVAGCVDRGRVSLPGRWAAPPARWRGGPEGVG